MSSTKKAKPSTKGSRPPRAKAAAPEVDAEVPPRRTLARHRELVWFCAVVVAVITFWVFSPSLKYDLIDWDDRDNFIRNPDYQGLAWSNIRWMFTTMHMGHYQPLTWSTLGFDTVWGGWVYGEPPIPGQPDPRPHHFTNVLLHSLNAVLVFMLCARLLSRAREKAGAFAGLSIILSSAAAALMFSIHPLRVESVAWATERRDLLSGFFLLLTVLAYLRATDTVQMHRTRWMVVALVLFAASLLSKVMGATLPVVLLLLDWYPLRRLPGSVSDWLKPPARNVLLEKVPFFLLSLIFSLLASIGQGSHGWLITPNLHPLWARIVQSLYGLVFYTWKTVWPTDLVPLYEMLFPSHRTGYFNQAKFYIAPVIAAIGLGAVLLLRRRAPGLLVVVLTYAVMLLPVLGLMQNGRQLVADRYSYLACMGWAVLAGWVLVWLSERSPRGPLRATAVAVAIGIVATLGLLTSRQLPVWASTASLWEYVVEHEPGSPSALNSHGYVLLTQGKLDEAIEMLERSIEVAESNEIAYRNLWDALRKKGDVAEYRAALERSSRIVQLPRLQVAALHRLGDLEVDQKRYAEAIATYQHAAELKPDPTEYPEPLEVRTNRALCMQNLGKTAEAEVEYRHVIADNPDFFGARYNFGVLLRNAGRSTEAIEQFRHAFRLKPEHAGTRKNLRDLTGVEMQ